MHYVYLLQLSEYPWFYAGETSDLRKRMIYHKNNQTQSTKRKNPRLVFFQACTNEKYAKIREKEIKEMPKGEKFQLISEFEETISLFK